MKTKHAFIGLVATQMAGTALAADLSSRKAPEPFIAPPVFTWTGFYAGLNLGGMTKNHIGVIGGGQIGYNWQWNDRFVAGVEADFNGRSNIRSSNGGFPGNGADGNGFLGTARVRVGFLATPSFLVYATGGLAYGTPWSSSGAPALISATSKNGVRAGYTVGAGVEYMLTPNWSVKAEYLYVDLGRPSTDAFAPIGGATRSDAHVARLGVNYRFNWGTSAPAVARY